jgi:hypothetical protein
VREICFFKRREGSAFLIEFEIMLIALRCMEVILKTLDLEVELRIIRQFTVAGGNGLGGGTGLTALALVGSFLQSKKK